MRIAAKQRAVDFFAKAARRKQRQRSGPLGVGHCDQAGNRAAHGMTGQVPTPDAAGLQVGKYQLRTVARLVGGNRQRTAMARQIVGDDTDRP